MQISRLLIGQTQTRLFSTATFKDVVSTNGASKILGARFTNYGNFRTTPVLEVRHWSSMASDVAREEKAAQAPKQDSGNENEGDHGGKAIVSSYWGVAPPKISKADGSPWRWNCFRV